MAALSISFLHERHAWDLKQVSIYKAEPHSKLELQKCHEHPNLLLLPEEQVAKQNHCKQPMCTEFIMNIFITNILFSSYGLFFFLVRRSWHWEGCRRKVMQCSSYWRSAPCHVFNWIDCFKCTPAYTNLQNTSRSNNQGIKNRITAFGEEWMTGGRNRHSLPYISINNCNLK